MRSAKMQRAYWRTTQRDERRRLRQFTAFLTPVVVVASAVLLLGVTLIAASDPDRSQVIHAAGYQRTAAKAHSPSGEPMPVGDIPGWHQVFSDDFTTDVPLGSFP